MTIRLLILDVDGVLTDGGIIFNDLNQETKRFHVHDGFAVRLWTKLGLHAAVITGRSAPVVTHRMNDLKVPADLVVQASADKLADLRAIWAKTGTSAATTAYIGDDWPDLEAMHAVAYPIAPANARPEVKAVAKYVTAASGGHGAVREAVEHLFHAMGRFQEALRLYDPSSAPPSSIPKF